MMVDDRRKSEVRSASERLGVALDRLENVLGGRSLASENGPRASDMRDEALAMADQASAAIDEAVSDLRSALTELTAEHGNADDGR